MPRARPWTQDEDVALRAAVDKHGTGNWVAVSNEPGLHDSAVHPRDDKRCEDRWRRAHAPLLLRPSIQSRVTVEMASANVNRPHPPVLGTVIDHDKGSWPAGRESRLEVPLREGVDGFHVKLDDTLDDGRDVVFIPTPMLSLRRDQPVRCEPVDPDARALSTTPRAEQPAPFAPRYSEGIAAVWDDSMAWLDEEEARVERNAARHHEDALALARIQARARSAAGKAAGTAARRASAGSAAPDGVELVEAKFTVAEQPKQADWQASPWYPARREVGRPGVLIFDDKDEELNNVPEAWPWVRSRTWCGAIVRYGPKNRPKVGKVVVLRLDGTLDLQCGSEVTKGVSASDVARVS